MEKGEREGREGRERRESPGKDVYTVVFKHCQALQPVSTIPLFYPIPSLTEQPAALQSLELSALAPHTVIDFGLYIHWFPSFVLRKFALLQFGLFWTQMQTQRQVDAVKLPFL